MTLVSEKNKIYYFVKWAETFVIGDFQRFVNVRRKRKCYLENLAMTPIKTKIIIPVKTIAASIFLFIRYF